MNLEMSKVYLFCLIVLFCIIVYRAYMLIVLILPTYKWPLPPFAADV